MRFCETWLTRHNGEMTPFDPPRSVYVHVPFCRHRCGYCDFTLIAGRDDLRDAYLDALEREMDRVGWDESASPTGFRSGGTRGLGPPYELDTLFFGGGTPSHLTGPQLERLVAIVRRRFRWHVGREEPAGLRPAALLNPEISLEANPLDLTDDVLELLAALSVNRLSIGVQSFDMDALRLLERDHSPSDVRALIPRVQRWFSNVSVDLIFGVPGQSLHSWRETLREAVDLGVTHISTYGLTFEPGTAFTTRRRRGELQSVDEELERTQYAAAMDDLAVAGFEQYEISNFARKRPGDSHPWASGFECLHNLNYWRGGTYYGFGPGAARYINGRRETNIRSTLGYLARLSRDLSPTAEVDELDAEDRARECIFLGLRMNAGMSRAEFRRHTGFDLDELTGGAIQTNLENGWLEDDGETVRLTHMGRFVADRVVADFV
jgi:oxygen-independent coproporphyrinogen-3 oxidase